MDRSKREQLPLVGRGERRTSVRQGIQEGHKNGDKEDWFMEERLHGGLVEVTDILLDNLLDNRSRRDTRTTARWTGSG
jgi:hypothetical protein